jgi:hypothetical protein
LGESNFIVNQIVKKKMCRKRKQSKTLALACFITAGVLYAAVVYGQDGNAGAPIEVA